MRRKESVRSAHSFATWSAQSVLPKRIFAFQSMRVPVLNLATAWSIAARCLGRKTMASDAAETFAGGMAERPFFAASMAAFAVSSEQTNHSLPWFPKENCFRFTPERRRMAWTSPSLKDATLPPWTESVGSA